MGKMKAMMSAETGKEEDDAKRMSFPFFNASLPRS